MEGNKMKDVQKGADGRERSGKARMAGMTSEQRRELGKKGAAKRWAIGSQDQTIYEPEACGDLPIIGHNVPCAVLMVDGEVVRVVSERGLIKSLGGKRGGSHWRRLKEDSDAANLPAILSANNLREFISDDLQEGLSTRYLYRIHGRGGMVAHGLRAELYPMICDVFLKARDKVNVLLPRQEDIAKSADILMRALAHTGIVALVDEATGYQVNRPQDALARILEAFIARELQPWVKTFPTDYYEHLFRLRGLDYKTDSVRRPQYFGCLTNDIIYKRLAPNVLAELKKVTIRNEDGRPKHKYFQRLTSNLGYPKLREHLGAAVALMKVSTNWNDFMMRLDRWYPPYGQTYQLPFGDYEKKNDDGKGL